MEGFVTALNETCSVWWRYAVHLTIQASLAALIALPLTRWLGRRWSSSFRYWLLVVALAAFLLPPVMAIPNPFLSVWKGLLLTGAALAAWYVWTRCSGVARYMLTLFAVTFLIIPLMPPFPEALLRKTVPDNVQTSADTSGVHPDDHRSAPAISGSGIVNTEPKTPDRITESPARSAFAMVHWKVWVVAVQAVGMGVIAALFIHQLIILARIRRRAVVVNSGDLYRRFLRLSFRLGLREPPALLTSPDRISPMALGILKPAVVLPASFTENLASDKLDIMIMHELAHHKRRDLLVNAVQIALMTVWWFNPFIRLLDCEIRRLRENSCDELVLASGRLDGRRYCEALLESAFRLANYIPSGATVQFTGRGASLKRRMEDVIGTSALRRPLNSRLSSVFLVFLVALLISCRQNEGQGMEGNYAEFGSAFPETLTARTVIVDLKVYPERDGESGPIRSERLHFEIGDYPCGVLSVPGASEYEIIYRMEYRIVSIHGEESHGGDSAVWIYQLARSGDMEYVVVRDGKSIYTFNVGGETEALDRALAFLRTRVMSRISAMRQGRA